ncbi:MAG: nucleoside deaminase [Bacteroidales bacterium]|nr:nucleoside deaminase [Candidatus Sodaliphilus aphodohippi]
MDKNEINQITEGDVRFLKMACDIASANIDRGGGPFGAVIVKNGEIVSTGGNTVTLDNDPTAHAEVNAIRMACKSRKNFKLEGCVIYSSCEPCPMCLSALYWAGVSRIYYGNTQNDARNINFDDNFIYQEIEKPHLLRSIPCVHIEDPYSIEHFKKWAEKTDKIEY